MIDKINNNQISDILRDTSVRQPNCLRSSADNKADALLQVSYESLVEKAQEEPAEDAKAVERARQLLLTGQLDSPANIRKAAENILKFGI
jgi:uncharacterized protein (UPF0147 family)